MTCTSINAEALPEILGNNAIYFGGNRGTSPQFWGTGEQVPTLIFVAKKLGMFGFVMLYL